MIINFKQKSMKTSTFLKSIVVIGLMGITTSGLFAQTGTRYNTVPASAAEATDTVALGARMPYFVATDPNTTTAVTAGFLNPSVYKWVFKDNADVLLAPQPSVLQYGGAAATTLGLAGYFDQNEISVTWSAIGSYEIEATEHSMPKTGTGCDGSIESRVVVVQALPTFAFNATSTGACAGGTTSFDLPITLSGSGPWKVSYTITLGGTTVAVPDQIVTNGKMPYTASITTLPLTVDLTAGALSGAAGTYTIAVTKVTDRITEKALNTTLAGTVNPASDEFTIGIIAAPTTQPIRHVTNL